MKIQRHYAASTNFEFGCDLRRLYPWHGVANPTWGSAIASVRPGDATTADAHDESETFIIISGIGRMEIDGEEDVLQAGDVVYIPKNSLHRVENLSGDERLVFLSIFWDSPNARDRMRKLLADDVDDI